MDRLASLLEQDFARANAALPPARAQWVTMLLQTLAEVLAAIGVPIVFAMDNRNCRVAIGPLLGQGRAMHKNLEIKLSSLR